MKNFGGSVSESNRPVTSKMPLAGFEDQKDHRIPCASVPQQKFLVSGCSFLVPSLTAKSLTSQTAGITSEKPKTRNEKPLYLIPRVAASASCFLEKYHCFTSRPLPEATRLAASSCVCGAGTITGSPGFQFAGVAQALASAVCSASKTRRISSTLRPSDKGCYS